VFSFIEVPEHGDSVFSSRSAEGSVWGDCDVVDVSSVSIVVGAEFAFLQVPDLDQFVPTTRDNDWVRWVWRESDARDPFRVAVFDDIEFAFTKSVPQFDGSITGSRDDLAVIRGEGDRQDVFFVTNESSSGSSSVEVPETEGLVPRSRESKLSVRRDDNVRDKVVVSSERFLCDTIVSFVASQVPDNESLVS